MSSASGKNVTKTQKPTIAWGPLAAVLVSIGVFFASQLLLGFGLGLFFGLAGWPQTRINDWLDSTPGQALLISISALITIGLLALFLRLKKLSFRALGYMRTPQWRDAAHVAVGFLVYFVLLVVASAIAGQILGVDTQQEQEIGFDETGSGSGGLALVFLSLVAIPPIVEETVFRGFLFGGLRTKLSLPWAMVITSVLFAIPHLFASSDGLLWIAAIDTFVLSLVLCYVREKTGALWACIGIHAVKNILAFIVRFVVQ